MSSARTYPVRCAVRGLPHVGRRVRPCANVLFSGYSEHGVSSPRLPPTMGSLTPRIRRLSPQSIHSFCLYLFFLVGHINCQRQLHFCSATLLSLAPQNSN